MLFVDLQILAEALASLTLAEAASLSEYIEQCEGPAGCLVEVVARVDGGDAAISENMVSQS